MESCKLFKDPAAEAQFEKDGFAVLDVLPKEAVQQILEFYKSTKEFSRSDNGVSVSMTNENSDYVTKVSDFLGEVIGPYLEPHFKDHQIIYSLFFVKDPDPESNIPLHQDSTIVDENKYWSASVWIPMVDVDINNGAIGLIKGSHRFYDTPRPFPHFHQYFNTSEVDFSRYMELIPLKAGQALVIHNKLIHGSVPNVSEHTRYAAVAVVSHKDADLRFLYEVPGEDFVLEEYQVDSNFYFSHPRSHLFKVYESGQGIEGFPSLGRRLWNPIKYSDEKLMELILEAGNQLNPELVARKEKRQEPPKEVMKKPAFLPPAEQQAPKERPASFWETYSLKNIIGEIRQRLK